jgi:hypothetical protein
VRLVLAHACAAAVRSVPILDGEVIVLDANGLCIDHVHWTDDPGEPQRLGSVTDRDSICTLRADRRCDSISSTLRAFAIDVSKDFVQKLTLRYWSLTRQEHAGPAGPNSISKPQDLDIERGVSAILRHFR